MKKKIRLTALLLTLLLLAGGCAGRSAASEAPVSTPLPEAWELRVAVASDLHLDPDNTNKNSAAPRAMPTAGG